MGKSKLYFNLLTGISLLSFLCPISLLAQESTQNWIKQIVYKKQTDTPIEHPKPEEAIVSLKYLDGLGRVVQQIDNRQSDTDKDIVTHIEYDEFGRQVKSYLPFVATDNTMKFYDPDDALSLTLGYSDYAGQNPFSETLFEDSPINRILKVAAPGTTNNWAMGSGHEVQVEYGTNQGDNIRLLQCVQQQLNDNGIYSDGLLYKTRTIDENGHASEEFKNARGQIILKRKFEKGFPVDTYYVFDEYDNLAYVIPPNAALLTLSHSELDNLCYQYQYDNKNRLIKKWTPGKKNWDYIVYDELDRIVATGPAYPPAGGDDSQKGWLVNYYDHFGRIAYTGWYPDDVNDMQFAVLAGNNSGGVNNVSRVVPFSAIDGIQISYSVNNLPPNFVLLTVNYYDNYDYPGAPTDFTSQVAQQDVFYNELRKPIGLPTGGWLRTLVSGTSTGETSYILYDNKARPIGTYKSNRLGGKTITETNFVDGLIQYTQTKHRRQVDDHDITAKDIFEYSPQGRLVKHFHQTNGGPIMRLAENEYNPLGRLAVKKCGDVTGTPFLQKVDYQYNIRGWLTGINDTSNLSIISSDPQDLFAFKINYDDTDGAQGGILPQYNGNISETYWRTKSDNVQRKYSYVYDDINRLTEAHYQKPESDHPLTGAYNENIEYDIAGNVIWISRTGNLDTFPNAVTIDDLTYIYIQDTNQVESVIDSSNNPQGFKDDQIGTVSHVDYTYDDAGNLTKDENKQIGTIKYNHLNLPVEIIFNNGSNSKISYIYNAAGEKTGKIVDYNDTQTRTTDYLDGFQYKQGKLQFFPTSEGFVNCTVTDEVEGGPRPEVIYDYVYNYVDHLGNVRLSYGKDPDTGLIKILQENQYYPYGLKHTNYNPNVNAYELKEDEVSVALKPAPPGDTVANINMYKYNGQEWQDEIGLNLYDMDMRDYDPAIGRWTGIDPVTHHNQTPYMAMDGDPILIADPSGADGVVPKPKGTVYGMAGQSSEVHYSNSGDNSSIFWGSSRMLFEQSFEGKNGSQTFFGAEARNVFSHFALANGYSRAVFTEPDSFATGGIGGGFYDYKTGSIKGDGLNIYGNGGDVLAGNGIGFGRGTGSIDARSLGGGTFEDYFNLGQFFGMMLNWMYNNDGVRVSATPQFQPQPFSVVVPAYVTVQRYNYTATDAFGNTKSSVNKGYGRDTIVINGDEVKVNKININDSIKQSVISSMKNAKHKKIYGY